MKVLITGANGFIGSALTRRLFERGDAVRILVRNQANLALLDGLPLVESTASKVPLQTASNSVAIYRGDLSRQDTLLEAAKNVDVVFHLAGLRRSPSAKELMAVNGGGTEAMCRAVAQMSPGARFILCSSLTAVGPSKDFPDENAPLNPGDWYGESKAKAEIIVQGFRDDLDVGIARLSRIVGPGDRENLTFFKIIERGIRLSIGGGPRPMSTLDVDDLTDGFIRLALFRGKSGEAFFLSRDTTTLEALLDEIARLSGKKTLRIHLPEGLLKVLATSADAFTSLSGKRLPLNRKLAQQLLAPGWTCSTAKAHDVLGFDPKISLSESIRRSLEWYLHKGWLTTLGQKQQKIQ